MSSLKRTGDPLHQSSPAKHPNLESTTDAIEAQSMDVDSVAPADVENDLKFVSPTRLPQSKLSALNAAIIEELAKCGNLDVYTGHLLVKTVLTTVLAEVQEQCKDILLQDASIVKELMGKHVSQLEALCKTAIEERDFSRIMLISQFWKQEDVILMKQLEADQKILKRAVEDSWTAPFLGHCQDVLMRNLRNMYRRSLRLEKKNSGIIYLTHTTIIQSSGSGKSRLVDEVARTIFTIPCNIRAKEDERYGAWPASDTAISSLLGVELVDGVVSEQIVYCGYLLFLQVLFRCTVEALDAWSGDSPQEHTARLASRWHDYLSRDGGKNRKELYGRVARETTTLRDRYGLRKANDVSKDVEKKILTSTKEALAELVNRVCPFPTSCPDASELHLLHGSELHLLVYFDEAHTLTKKLIQPQTDQPSGPIASGKYPLDVLYTAMDDLRLGGLFSVFMSTESKLHLLAPSATTARSARYGRDVSTLHPPLTETPFDCFGSFRIDPKRIKASDLCDIAFMSCFGRPLWRSLLWPFTDSLLKQFAEDGENSELIHFSLGDPNIMQQQYSSLLNVARQKLLCDMDISRPCSSYSRVAQSAVLDARVHLSFEPSRISSQQHVAELVASHMRTAYSIPKHREYIRSGYSSEPMLALAAAQLMHDWDAQSGTMNNPAVSILQAHLDHDLLHPGEGGEAVARTLLLTARDRATPLDPEETDHWRRPSCARLVPVNNFIPALFTKDVAEAILESVPDNLPPIVEVLEDGSETVKRVKFKEAFKNAVINFTHFAKFADDSAIDQRTALGCFLRGMAPICRNNAQFADAFIPVCMDPSKPLTPENMSGIIVQIKARATAGSTKSLEFTQKQVGLFPTGSPLRAYVTLFMELGVTHPPPPLARTPTHYDPDEANKKKEKKAFERQRADDEANKKKKAFERQRADRDGPQSALAKTPSKFEIPAAPSRRRRVRADHPRYSIFVYGCSPTVYNVIREHERPVYRKILRAGQLLGEHPNQDERSLAMVRNQKPFFAVGHASWHWLDGSYGLSPDEDEWNALWTEGQEPVEAGATDQDGGVVRVGEYDSDGSDHESDGGLETDEHDDGDVKRDDGDVFMESPTHAAGPSRRPGSLAK